MPHDLRHRFRTFRLPSIVVHLRLDSRSLGRSAHQGRARTLPHEQSALPGRLWECERRRVRSRRAEKVDAPPRDPDGEHEHATARVASAGCASVYRSGAQFKHPRTKRRSEHTRLDHINETQRLNSRLWWK